MGADIHILVCFKKGCILYPLLHSPYLGRNYFFFRHLFVFDLPNVGIYHVGLPNLEKVII